MRFLIAYWIFGCLFVGGAIGFHRSACPDDRVSAAELVVAVAAWPYAFVEAMYVKGSTPICGTTIL